MYNAFKTWLETKTALSKKSISNYTNALNKITRDLINESMIINNLNEIKQAEQVEQVKAEYFAIDKYKEQDIKGRNMYNAAFNKYIYFIRETKKERA